MTNLIEGIWQRYPTGLTDKNFTIKTNTYKTSIYASSIQSAGASLLASAGGTFVDFETHPLGSSGFEMLLFVN